MDRSEIESVVMDALKAHLAESDSAFAMPAFVRYVRVNCGELRQVDAATLEEVANACRGKLSKADC